MSLSSLQTIIYIVLIALKLNQVKSQNISIIRRERDVFTKTASCNLTKAVCYDTNCTYCQCERNRMTFIQSRGEYGECVANEHLIFVTSYNLSFLAQEGKKKRCLDYYFGPRQSKYRFAYSRSCNPTSLALRWFWTRSGQLFNLETLECLTIGWKYLTKDYYFLILEKCVENNKKQLWKCGCNDQYYVWQEEWKGYLNYGDGRFPRYLVSHEKESLQWRRYGSNQTLCSEAVGCDTFKDGSPLIVLNQTTKCEEMSHCFGEKEIDAGRKVKECSLLQNRTQYLLRDRWIPLLAETGSLDVEANDSKILFKWNLNKTPRSWKGIIVKVHFQCKSGEDEQKKTDVYCILIKYSGIFSGFHKSNGNDKQSDKDEAKTVVIIVCVLLIALLTAITAFLGYRNKSRLTTFIRRKAKRPDKNSSAQTSPGQLSGDCNNPIYASDGNKTAENSCDLYETTESEHEYQCANGGTTESEHVYQCANGGDEVQAHLARENQTYDYAVSEEQMSNQFPENPVELKNAAKLENLYHVLENENPQIN